MSKKRCRADCHKDATFPAKLENIDDMGFIHALIARMAQEHGVDTKHVFVLSTRTRPGGAGPPTGVEDGTMSKLRLSLTIPGAVSLGAYEGGALAALILAARTLG